MNIELKDNSNTQVFHSGENVGKLTGVKSWQLLLMENLEDRSIIPGQAIIRFLRIAISVGWEPNFSKHLQVLKSG